MIIKTFFNRFESYDFKGYANHFALKEIVKLI